MKNLFFIDDSLANKISYYHLLALLVSLPFDMFYSYVLLGSFAIHTLLNVKHNNFKRVFAVQTIILQSVFWVTLVSLFYSHYKGEGYTELGRRTIMLWLPILLSLSSLDIKKHLDNLLLGFSLCCTFTILYLFGDALRIIRFYRYPLSALFTPPFINHNFSEPIGMHATFFSLQVAMALVYLLNLIMKPGRLINKLFYGISSLVLLAGIIQLGSKSVFASVIIITTFLLPFFLLIGKKRYLFIIIYVSLAVISIFVLLRSETFRERYLTDLKRDLSAATPYEITDSRLARWTTAIGIIKTSPLIGHGTGAEIPILNDAYYSNKLYNSYLNKLNAHNEYLSFLLKSGMLGLLAYLVTLTYGFKIAILQKDFLFCSFITLIAMVSLSENLLDVDKGIIFYGVFFCLFLKSNPSYLSTSTTNTEVSLPF